MASSLYGVNDIEDAFYLERLDAFKQKNLADVAAFAARESKNPDEIIRHIAEWHCNFLFNESNFSKQPQTSTKANHDIRQSIRKELESISSHLDSLSRASGLQSFFLVIDPGDESDDGFLGGTILGREFWRGMRTGGVVGARTFRTFCRSTMAKEIKEVSRPLEDTRQEQQVGSLASEKTATGTKKTPAISLKNKLYSEMRTALRSVCGIRNAEMKWTKPEKLSAYGVTMIGWPGEVAFKNPSQMSVIDMSKILELLESKTLHFQRTATNGPARGSHSLSLPQTVGTAGPSTHSQVGITQSLDEANDDIDLSWACNDDDDAIYEGSSPAGPSLSTVFSSTLRASPVNKDPCLPDDQKAASSSRNSLHTGHDYHSLTENVATFDSRNALDFTSSPQGQSDAFDCTEMLGSPECHQPTKRPRLFE